MIEVYIDEFLRGSYEIPKGSGTRDRYTDVNSGPLQIISTNNQDIISALRVVVSSSYTEFMGLPADQLTDEYWFPWYNNLGFDSRIRFANTSVTNAANIEIYAGGDLLGAYELDPLESMQEVKFDNMDAGPVNIVSRTGTPIVASLSIITPTSYSEFMGLPANQLADEYWFPWYNNVGFNSGVRFGNASSTQTAIVKVYAGGNLLGTYELGPGESTRDRYSGVDAGPMRIVSTTGTPIIAALRIVMGASYAELMGLPKNRLTDEYLFPWYNNVGFNSGIRFGNTSATETTTVKVYVGETLLGSYNLGPGESTRDRFFNIDEGLMRVVSTNGVKIIAAMRIVTSSSYTELMGFPSDQLTDEYWFPWYNNVTYNSGVRFGFP
jgi:hypothetical protein